MTTDPTIIAFAVVGAAIVVGSLVAERLLHHTSSLPAG